MSGKPYSQKSGLKNHINPITDAPELMREEQEDRESVKSDKTFPKNPKKKMTVKGRYGSTFV